MSQARSQRGLGLALAGGGPLGAIYEIGALVALGDSLKGFDPTDCDIYVGVSSGGFICAALANGISARSMHSMFIESEQADDPFEPGLLLRPALLEYVTRFARLPDLLASAVHEYFTGGAPPGVFASLGRLARALPAGVFDNGGVGHYLARLLSAPGRSNDFRRLAHKLFLVATDIDTGEPVAFGARGWDDVPIARAVQASAALPGLFPPVEINGRFYVDGALTKTLHASVGLREGARLMLCVNPLVPFNARLAARHGQHAPRTVFRGGLPSILSQSLRTLIYSRMRTGMERYGKEFPRADVLLFQPAQDDVELFFTNIFSYADRRRLCEHAYQKTREDLRRRREELRAPLARHGISIDEAALADPRRTLLARRRAGRGRKVPDLAATAASLAAALDRLESLLPAFGRPVAGRGRP
jgi:predicted acylesterase/phospholipase RssA